MTFGSLFAGIGGIDLGLERAGLECRWQVEIDAYCCRVLAKYWPDVKRYGDIRTLTGDELEPVDLIAGGFPCQDLSNAGKRAGIEGTRSGLWFEFARLVGRLGPRWILIENVPGILVHSAMRRVIGELARCGYVGCWRSLRASEFGASHLRKRVFIVAHRNIERSGEFRCGRLFDGKRETYRNDSDGCDPHVAQCSSPGFGELRQPSGGDGFSDGCNPELADTEHARCERCPGIRFRTDRPALSATRSGESDGYLENAGCTGPGRPPQPAAVGRSGAPVHDCGTSRTLAHGIGAGLEERRRERSDDAQERPTAERDGGTLADSGERFVQDQGQQPQRRDGSGSGSETLGTFAPGPADPRWPAILAARPDLAPALKSQIRGMADGLPGDLERAMKNRTKRLGRLGNAVVPDCAEWIGRKILEFERNRLYER